MTGRGGDGAGSQIPALDRRFCMSITRPKMKVRADPVPLQVVIPVIASRRRGSDSLRWTSLRSTIPLRALPHLVHESGHDPTGMEAFSPDLCLLLLFLADGFVQSSRAR